MDSFLDIIPITALDSQSNQPKDIKYSKWIKQSTCYIPAVEISLADKLPSGVYKIIFNNSNGDYEIHQSKLNSDELYCLDDSSIQMLLKELEDFWNKAEIYKQNNLIHKRGILLEGPSGTGKTSTITLLINQIIERGGLVFLVNTVKDFQTLYEALNEVIRKIEPDRPIITVIEDVDKLIDTLNNDSELLDLLDGKASINHHVVIMTSNDTSNLSEALLRPSRIDLRLLLDVPTPEVVKQFFCKKGVKEEELDEFVKLTKGMSFADLKEVFISTYILGKDLQKTISQLKNPLNTKYYLNKNSNFKI